MEKCRDCGAVADPRYTMDFTDVEPDAFIYWCAACGPDAVAINNALQNALADGSIAAAELEAAIDDAEAKVH